MSQAISVRALEALACIFLGTLPGAAAAHSRKAVVLAPQATAQRAPAAAAAALSRLARAVEGAESSYGENPGMWRPDPAGPQGPMQVTAAAAADVGGGDRFDPMMDLTLGRAYLAQMYRRFGSWSEAVAAYNWGPGNLDSWLRNGHSPVALPPGVARYRNRVLAAAELPLPKGATRGEGWSAALRRPHFAGIAHAQPRRMGVAARAGIGYAQIASLYNQLMRASASDSR